MDNRNLPIKLEDQLVLHLLNFGGFEEEYKVPFPISQLGIARILNATRSHISYYIKKMKRKGIIVERLGRIIDLPRKRKVYFLTDEGREYGRELAEKIMREGLEIDFRGTVITITLDRGIFEKKMTSALALILEKVVREFPQIPTAVQDEEEDYLINLPGQLVHPAYGELITPEMLELVEEAIDKGRNIVLDSPAEPELSFTCLEALALKIQEFCNVFIWDFNRLTTRNEIHTQLLNFIGRMGDHSLQSWGYDEIETEEFTEKYRDIITGLPLVILVRINFSSGNLLTMESKEHLLEIASKGKIPIIMGNSCGLAEDDPILSRIYGDEASLLKLALSPPGKDDLLLIAKKIRGAREDELNQLEQGFKEMCTLCSQAPLILANILVSPGEFKRDHLIQTLGFSSELLDALELDELSILHAMCGLSHPIGKEQLNEKTLAKLDELNSKLLVYKTEVGYWLGPKIRRLVCGNSTDKEIATNLLEFYRGTHYLNEHQVLDTITLLFEAANYLKSLVWAVDWSRLYLENPSFIVDMDKLHLLYEEIDEINLSREVNGLLILLRVCLQIFKGNLDEAETLANEVLLTGEQMKNVTILTRANYLLGKIYLKRGDLQGSLERFVVSYNLSITKDEQLSSSLAALSISAIYGGMGELNRALAYIDMAAGADKGMFFSPLVTTVYAAQARLYKEKDILTRVVSGLTKAGDMAMRTGRPDEGFKYMMAKAEALSEAGHDKEAAYILESVARRAEEKGDGHIMLLAFNSLWERCYADGTLFHQIYKQKSQHLSAMLKRNH